MYGATDQATEPLFLAEESPEPEVGSAEEVRIPGWALLLVLVLVVVPSASLWVFQDDKPVSQPTSSAPPATSTMTEVHKERTTIIREVKNSSRPEAPRSDEKAVVVLSTEESKAPSSVSPTSAVLPTSPSVSDTSSAPSTTTELPTITTSASSAPTTSAVTPASSSEAP